MKHLAKILKSGRNHFEGAHNVIPEIDPDSHSQTAADWIRKVNETARIYGWSEKQIIYYAIPKLVGHAKKWYQGRSTVDLTWYQWQKKIIKIFPDDRNYADRLAEMLSRRSRQEESLEEYFHEKARLVKMCGITGRNAVDCIVSGIFDSGVRLNAQGSSLKRPSQLLKYLRRISKRSNMTTTRRDNTLSKNEPQTTRNFDVNRSNALNKPPFNNARERTKSTLQCFNCAASGNKARSCPKPLTRCEKCFRLGHNADGCDTVAKLQPKPQANDSSAGKPNHSQNVLQITSTDKTNSKYFKSITLNGHPCGAYVDFGSQCSIIKQSLAKTLKLTGDAVGLPVIKGFGFGCISPLSKVFVTIVVDAVEADILAYVVPDHLLSTDVLIGQSLTELPTVVAYKTNDKLILYCDSSDVEKMGVFNTEDVTILGLKDIAVHTNEDYTGMLFVPGSVCMQPGNEYMLLQGLYQFHSGKGRCIILSLSTKGATLQKDKLLGRTIIMQNFEFLKSKVEHLDINVVETDQAKRADIKEPIVEEMLNIGPKVSDEERLRLLELLNRFRDCFAFNTQELGLTHITEMTLRLNDDTPVSYRPYRLPFSERAKVREMVGEWRVISQRHHKGITVGLRKPNSLSPQKE